MKDHNAKIFAIGSGVAITPGTSGVGLRPELGPEPVDIVLRRWHGIGPMGGTDLDAILRTSAFRRSSPSGCRSTSRSPTW
jgi:hypothetical protein